jgi:hypothetical protein
MEYRNDLADILLNGLPDEERKQVLATISQVDAEKLRRKRASGADADVVDLTELDGDELDDDGYPATSSVPRQG